MVPLDKRTKREMEMELREEVSGLKPDERERVLNQFADYLLLGDVPNSKPERPGRYNL